MLVYSRIGEAEAGILSLGHAGAETTTGHLIFVIFVVSLGTT
jgi:hypothetical protein